MSDGPFFPGIPLSTERLRIRELVSADAEAIFRMFSEPEVMIFWSNGPYTEAKQAVDFIENCLRGYREGSFCQLGVELLDIGEIIGTCTLHSFNRQCRRAELGYVLARPYWGQGYNAEALRRFVTWAFEDLDLHRLEADIHPENEPSRRALKRLGFQSEGYLRERWIVDGVVSDSEVFGLLRSEFSPLLTD